MKSSGQTLKQFQNSQFFEALAEYETALKSKNSKRIILSTIRVSACAMNRTHTRLINRVFKNHG